MNLPQTFTAGVLNIPAGETGFPNGRILSNHSDSMGLCFILQDPTTNTKCKFTMYADQDGIIRTGIEIKYHDTGDYFHFRQDIDCEVRCDKYPWDSNTRRDWKSLTISDGGLGYGISRILRTNISWHFGRTEEQTIGGMPLDEAFENAGLFISNSLQSMLREGAFPDFSELNAPFQTQLSSTEILMGHTPDKGSLEIVDVKPD